MVRYVVDRVSRKKSDLPTSELESEMSPGMLFSTGYIAGGTIAGVLIAFLNFNDATAITLAAWQYRTTSVPAAASFDGQCQALAKRELGPKPSDKQLDRLTAEIRELNEVANSPAMSGYRKERC